MNKKEQLKKEFLLCWFVLIIQACATSASVQQLAFVDSSQYKELISPIHQPVLVYPYDFNNDGMSDAWVLMESKSHHHVETWLQEPAAKNEPARYKRFCKFDSIAGTEIKTFAITNFDNDNTAEAVLLTKEDSPEEVDFWAQILSMQNHEKPCLTLFQKKIHGRSYTSTNWGRRVYAMPNYQEGFVLDTTIKPPQLIEYTEPKVLPITTDTHKVDLIVGMHKQVWQMKNQNFVSTTKQYIDLAPPRKVDITGPHHQKALQALTDKKQNTSLIIKASELLDQDTDVHTIVPDLDANTDNQSSAVSHLPMQMLASFTVQTRDPKPIRMMHIAWGCFGQLEKAVTYVKVVTEDSQFMFPLDAAATLSRNIAGIKDLSRTKKQKNFMIFVLKTPIAGQTFKVIWYIKQPVNQSEFCLREIGFR